MLDIESDSSIPARYNVATFPENHPMMFAVNSGEVWLNGEIDFGEWFRSNNLSMLQALLDDAPMPKQLSAHAERILRRCVVFKVEQSLLDVENSKVSLRKSNLANLMKGRAGKY